MIHGMAGTGTTEMADQWAPGEIEIAHGIEDFMSDKFISVTQTGIIEDLFAADDDGII